MKTMLAASSLAISMSLGLAAPAAHAQNGTPLLDLALYGQLERWLGAGPLDLRNIYKPEDLRSRGFKYASIGRA